MAAQANESGKPFDKEALRRIAEPLQEFQLMAKFGYPLTVPPLDPGEARDHWQTMGASLLEAGHAGDFHPKSVSLSPGKPTMKSPERAISGRAARIRSTSRR